MDIKWKIRGPWSSSQWHHDAVALGMVDKNSKALTKAFIDKKSFFDQLDFYLDTVEEIYFAGGEPLMMEEHYQLLELLIDRKRFDVKLKYNTNLSTLTFQHWDIVQLWKHFEHVNVAASLDASGKRGEFLRKNIQWSRVLAYRRRMIREIPHVDFMISPTTCLYNVWHLPDFHREWMELKLIRAEDFVPTLLIHPEYFNIRIIPGSLRIHIVRAYHNHIKWLEMQKFVDEEKGRHVIQQYKNILLHLDQGDHSHLLPTFYTHNFALDELRSENVADIFPELIPLLKIFKTNT
jgi:hypothetical protein